MDRAPPLKRRRDEEDSQQSDRPETNQCETAFTPDKQFWMYDGSVILVCESVGYRVHQGVLSQHSKIFQDMFAVGTSQGEETFEGCVVVRLQDDPEDFKHLLKSFYDIRYPAFESKISLVMLRRLLLIANKYMVEDLRKQTIEHLRILFPSRREGLTSEQRDLVLPDDFSGMLGVQISQESHVPAILPAACYFAAFLRPSVIFNDNTGPNQDVSPAARQRCILFRETQLDTMLHRVAVPLIWNEKELSSCPFNFKSEDPNKSQGFSTRTLHDFSAYYTCRVGGVSDIKFREYFWGFVQHTGNDGQDIEPCETCWRSLDIVEEKVRDKAWETIPLTCGFKDWAAVEAAQARTNEDVLGV